jgi:4-hydroxybenzoate polyprenyltransferase
MTKGNQYLKPIHLSFWKAYFIHMRPYLLFISGVVGLAGMATGIIGGFEITDPKTLLTFLPFFLGYGFGQALTDCFQVDTDSISAPYRPLSQGIVSPKSIGIVSVLGLVFCATILISYNYLNAIFGLMSIIGLATYSFFKKRFWFAGPFYNAWIVALLPIMGFLAMTDFGWYDLSNPDLVSVVLLSFFSYANFVLIGYLKDISADRETNYKTFPVVFGWNASVWIGDVFAILSIYFCSKIAFSSTEGIIFWGAGTLIAILGQSFAHFTKNKTESNAAFPIVGTVRSLILWHLAVVLGFHPGLLLFAVVFYILFELVLFVRPVREQI